MDHPHDHPIAGSLSVRVFLAVGGWLVKTQIPAERFSFRKRKQQQVALYLFGAGVFTSRAVVTGGFA